METPHNEEKFIEDTGVIALEQRIEDTSAEIDRLSSEYAALVQEIEAAKKENIDAISSQDMQLLVRAESLRTQLDELIRTNEVNLQALEMIEPLKAKIDQMFKEFPVSTQVQ